MHGNNEFFNISDDIIYYEGLVWDSIDRGKGGEEGGGYGLLPYLLNIIMDIYMCLYWILL